MTIIPLDQLRRETLHALIEEFITRDGAVHGHHDKSADEKIAAVLKLLETGVAVIVFDEATDSASIVLKDSAPPQNPAAD